MDSDNAPMGEPLSEAEQLRAEIQARVDACERGPHGQIGLTAEMFMTAGSDIEFLLAENKRLHSAMNSNALLWAETFNALEESKNANTALVSALASLRSDLDASDQRVGVLEGQLATARALHKPERRYVTPDDDESSYDDPEWIAEAWEMPVEQVNYFTVCSHCGSIELGTGGRDYRESLWPCPDAKALGLDGGGSDER